MKPIKLVMQAFGPFADMQEVDFTQLGDNALFLINGPTGAGKTTLLDAICYALYGSTTGNEREGKDMRCDYADGTLLTRVEFTFMLGEQRYRIERIPEQEREKARGAGTTTQPAKVILWKVADNSEDVLGNKAGEVGKIIHELTGLAAEQFRQVMVLPQGKFREFLLADSKKREDIFSTLFQTQIYQKIQDALKNKAGNIDKDYKAAQQKKLGVLQAVNVGSEAELSERAASLTPELEQKQLVKEEAEAVCAQHRLAFETADGLVTQFASLKQQQAALADCEAQQGVMDNKAQQLQQAQQADRIVPLRTACHEKLAELEKLNGQSRAQKETVAEASKELVAAEEQLEQARKAAAGIEPARQKKQELDGILPNLSQLALAQQQLANTRQQLEKAQAAVKQAEVDIQQQQQNSELLQQTIAALRMAVDKEAEASLAASESSQRVKQKQDLLKLESDEAKKSGEVTKSATRCEQQAEKVRVAETGLKQLKLQWHSNQAVLLARELQDGMPCAVCGSKEHPRPARPEDSLPLVEREDVEAAEKTLKTENELLASGKNLLATLQAELASLQQRVGEQRELLGDFAGKTLEFLQAESASCQARVVQIARDKTALAEKEQQAAGLKDQCGQLEQQLTGLRQAVTDAQVAKAQAGTACEQLEKQVPEQWRDQNMLLAEIRSLENRIKALDTALQQAVTNQQQASNARTAAESTQAQLAVQLGETLQAAEQARTAWQSALVHQGFADEQAFETACLPAESQQVVQQQLELHKSKMIELKTTVSNLRAALAGKTEPDIEALQATLKFAEEAKQAAELAWSDCNGDLNGITQAITQLNKLNRDSAELNQQYQLYGTLSSLANGTQGEKISLQRFVLGVLLDDVLMQATQRLAEMSKGRYRLLRAGSSRDGRSTAGLDLAVLDEYTGRERPVATLSGGESFMAALSLALGLSDVVQAYAGGIRLDTLFIDEGFGSLDSESLDLAIRTLQDLQAAGRTIGIISHVSELKEQMALRLDVIPSRQGSCVQVVC